jgi:hypothetical protein
MTGMRVLLTSTVNPIFATVRKHVVNYILIILALITKTANPTFVVVKISVLAVMMGILAG